MTIKVQFLRDDETELASIEFGMPNAALFRILDMYREQAALGDATPIARPAAAKQMARAWVRDLRARAHNHEAGKAAAVAVAAITPDAEPVETGGGA